MSINGSSYQTSSLNINGTTSVDSSLIGVNNNVTTVSSTVTINSSNLNGLAVYASVNIPVNGTYRQRYKSIFPLN